MFAFVAHAAGCDVKLLAHFSNGRNHMTGHAFATENRLPIHRCHLQVPSPVVLRHFHLLRIHPRNGNLHHQRDTAHRGGHGGGLGQISRFATQIDGHANLAMIPRLQHPRLARQLRDGTPAAGVDTGDGHGVLRHVGEPKAELGLHFAHLRVVFLGPGGPGECIGIFDHL